MIEKIDMDKLQKLVFFINNVKMSGIQRERLNRVIIGGIIQGEIDTEKLLTEPFASEETSISKFLDSVYLNDDEELRGKWVQAISLYERYDRWCSANGLRPETLTVFGRSLKDMGVEFKRKADGNYYLLDSDNANPPS